MFKRKSYRFCNLAFFLLFYFSCSPPKHSGFSETSSGIFYKIHSLGDGKFKAKKGDFAKVSFQIKMPEDSGMVAGNDSIVHLTEMKNQKFQECISLLAEGDSATFMYRNSEIEDEKTMELKVQNIYSAGEFEEVQKYLTWKNDGEMNELKKLNGYLQKHKINNGCLTDGIYFIPQKKGKGKMLEIGNTVVVHYKGSLLDSTEFFDSTYEKNEPFEFKFGDDDQVIRGLELAICQMKKSEKAKIIIPSQLAFGETGSSTGVVPPFATVIYEVEIVNIK